ncbi:MAG: nickel insertion protein, partial [Succiniclasticum sp.]
MKALYIEPFAGISGNMLLGALLDAGVPFVYLQEEFSKLHLGDYELIYKSVNKSGIQARYFNVALPEEHEHHHEHDHAWMHAHGIAHSHDHEHVHEEHHGHENHHDHDHAHEHHHHEHRNLHDIEEILDRSELSKEIIAKAKEVFLAIAQAEA